MNDTLSKLGLQCLEAFGAKIDVLSYLERPFFDGVGYAGLPASWLCELKAEEMDAAISNFERLTVQLTVGFIPPDLGEDMAEQFSSSKQKGGRTEMDSRQMPPLLESSNRTGQSLEGMSNRESKYVETTASERVPKPQPNWEVNDEGHNPGEETANWQAPRFSPKEKARTQLPEIPNRIYELGQEFKPLGGLREMGGLFEAGRMEPAYENDQPGDQEIGFLENLSFAATLEQEVQREAGAFAFRKASLKPSEMNIPTHKGPENRNEWQTHQEKDTGQSIRPNTPELGSLSINLNEILEELKEKLQNDYERYYGEEPWL